MYILVSGQNAGEALEMFKVKTIPYGIVTAWTILRRQACLVNISDETEQS